MIDLRDHFAGFLAGRDDIGLLLAQRFHAQVDAELFGQFQPAYKCAAHAVPALLVVPTLFDIALHGRADDHHLAAEVATKLYQRLEVIAGALVDLGIGVGDVEAVGAGQQPMQADDLDAGFGGGGADLIAAGGGDVFDAGGQGEGGYFDAFVAEISGVVKDVFYGNVFEVFVAGGEFHCAVSFGIMTG